MHTSLHLVISSFSKYIQSIIYEIIQQPLNIISIGSTQKYTFKNACIYTKWKLMYLDKSNFKVIKNFI